MRQLRSQSEFEAFHRAFDGKLKGCPQGTCGGCCEPKVMETENPFIKIDKPFAYTAEVNEWELIGWTRMFGSLSRMGISVRSIATPSAPGPNTRFFIENCQNTDGTCKFEEYKPLICKTYPFGMTTVILSGCPRWHRITRNRAAIQRILGVREALGMGSTNQEYLERLLALQTINDPEAFFSRVNYVGA